MDLNHSFLPGTFAILYYHWVKSLRIKVFGRDHPPPVAYVFWHSKLFALPYTHKRQGIRVLVSEHPDTVWIERILRNLGFSLARGSSTRGGAKGAISLLRAVKDRKSIAITPDGPKGPREEVKEGVITLLRMLRIPVIPVGVAYRRKLVLNTWDRLELPLPLTKCAVYLSDPIPPNNLEDLSTSTLTNRLRVANKRAIRMVEDESFI